MIEVDLNTRMLSQSHEIYYARPGATYKFYEEFFENKAIFLDLPGFDLSPDKVFSKQENIIPKIFRARRIKGWHRIGDTEPRPPSDLNEYPQTGGDAGMPQVLAALSGYFEKAQKGDLVLVTPKAFQRNAYIGEFIDGPERNVKVQAYRFYQNDAMPGREVKWLARIEKRFLTSQVLEVTKVPNIFVTLPRSAKRSIYDLVYSGYSVSGDYTARFDITEKNFSTRDDFLLQSFFNFVSFNTKAIAEGREQDFENLSKAAFLKAGEYTSALKAEVSSPGFLNLTSATIAPLVAAALFAIAIEIGDGALNAAETGTLRIGNSQASADDPCVADIAAQAINQIKLSGAIGWPEACEKAREAASNTGAKGPARVKRGVH